MPKLILYALLGYVLLVAVLFIMQRKLLYLPDTRAFDTLQTHPSLIAWPSRQTFRGWRIEPDGDDIRGTVVIFHGNAGAASDRVHYAPALGRLGYRVLLAEYPGYAGRPGHATEATLVQDAQTTLRLSREAFDGPLIVWGESLGSGVAAAALAENAVDVDALVLLTPWDSLTTLATSIYWYAPVRWLLRDRYDSLRNLASFRKPVAIIAAERDRVIPVSHARALYASLDTPKRLWIWPGAGHNTWPAAPTEVWWTDVMTFVGSETGE